MNYSTSSGIIRYIRTSKTFSKFRAFRSSVRFEVPYVSKFRVLRSSVRFEIPCGHRKKVTLLRNFGKWGYWNRISKKMIIPITPAPTYKNCEKKITLK